MPDASGDWHPRAGDGRDADGPGARSGCARDYLLLALRLDQRIPGLVDGYFGPAELKARVDMEQGRAPATLRQDAADLRERLTADVSDADRRAWLDAQLVALETQAAALAGDALPYLDHVTRCFAYRPPRRPDGEFDEAAAAIDALLPGDAAADRPPRRWDRRFETRRTGCPRSLDWLVARFRARAATTFGLPDGEDLRVSLVRDQPWSGYNWFDGGRRSRVDINTDLPVRAAALIDTVAHETYPGHHLEHAWKEADLVDGLGRLEASVLLINTPECLISEGLADLGIGFAAPDDERTGLLVELYERAGLAVAADPVAAREAAERTVALAAARRALSAVRRQRRDPPARGWPQPRGGARLPPDRRPDVRRDGREAPRVHRAPALADVRLRLRRGRGAAPSLGRRRAARRSGRPLRTPAARAAHACGGRGSSSRLKRTRSSPSPSKSAQDGVP